MKYITNRQEIAYAMNFGRFPVVRINLESSKAGYEGLYEGDLVKVLTPTKSHPDLYAIGRVYYSTDSVSKFYISNDNIGLHDSFDYSDVIEMLNGAQAPVLRAGCTIVLIEDYPHKRMCKVRMMKVSERVYTSSYPCATLEDVPDNFDTSIPKNW